MNSSAQQVIQAELEPGERLLWSGQPLSGLQLRGSDGFLIPFSILWGGASIFAFVMAIVKKAALFSWLVLVPFVLVGLYLLAGRFFLDARKRKNTFYGLTDNRVIIVSNLFSKKIKSLSLRTLTDISLSESLGGRGSISFGNSSPFVSMYDGTPWPGVEQYQAPRFDLIEDAKAVYNQIRDAQKKTD